MITTRSEADEAALAHLRERGFVFDDKGYFWQPARQKVSDADLDAIRHLQEIGFSFQGMEMSR